MGEHGADQCRIFIFVRRRSSCPFPTQAVGFVEQQDPDVRGEDLQKHEPLVSVSPKVLRSYSITNNGAAYVIEDLSQVDLGLSGKSPNHLVSLHHLACESQPGLILASTGNVVLLH